MLLWERGDSLGALAAFERAEAHGFGDAALFAEDVRDGVRIRRPSKTSITVDPSTAEALARSLRESPPWLKRLAAVAPPLAARIAFKRLKREAARLSATAAETTASESELAHELPDDAN